MKKFFKEYHPYFVYCIAFFYVLTKAYYNEIEGEFLEVHIKEIIAFTLFILLILANSIIKRFEVYTRDNDFIATLQNDLTSDRNPFFVQIRKDKVPAAAILGTISEAVLSKEWWDFSYLAKTKEMIEEIESSFDGSNKTANLTILKKFPFKKNYIFIGTIQRDTNVGFPITITLLPSPVLPYNIEFSRLYIYKEKKTLFSKKYNSFRLINDNILIEKKYKKIINKLNKNIGDSFHVIWNSEGKVNFKSTDCANFSEFMSELKK